MQRGYDIETAILAADKLGMHQPGVLVIGNQYFVKVDGMVIKFPDNVVTLEEAVGLAVSYIFVLNTQYAEPLKFVYLFFENLFQFKQFSLARSQTVQRLFSKVWKA